MEITKPVKKRKSRKVHEIPAYATYDLLDDRQGMRKSLVKPRSYWESLMHYLRVKQCQRDSYHTEEPIELLPFAEPPMDNNFKRLHQEFSPYTSLGIAPPSQESVATSSESVFGGSSNSSLVSSVSYSTKL